MPFLPRVCFYCTSGFCFFSFPLRIDIWLTVQGSMNSSNFKLCEKIVPPSYVRQGLEARKVLENRIMQLLEQVCILCDAITNS